MKSSIAAVATLALALAVTSPGAARSLPSSSLSSSSSSGSPASGVVATDTPRLESFAVAGSSIKRIRATVAVNAPIDRVRAVVFDYARYPEFMPRYERATVIRTTASGARLVQMELGGIISLWMRVDISAPAYSHGTESYEGRLVAGNVRAFVPRWELESLGEGRTRVTVESFLDPDLALVPSSLINSGARDGIRDATVALKTRIEGRAQPPR